MEQAGIVFRNWQILTCPVDGSPLAEVRDSTGQVIALHSGKREYPVVDGVPRLMPDTRKRGRRAWGRWEKLLMRWLQAFGEPLESEPPDELDPVAAHVAQVMVESGGGLFLDIGCGTRPLPPIMAASRGELDWIGIDPVVGDVGRRFPLVQAVAEYLPFQPRVFDGALFDMVLSQLIDPRQAMDRARRALKPGRRVYVWYYACPANTRYAVWKVLRSLGLLAWPYNDFYPWAFTKGAVPGLLRRAGFVLEQMLLLCDACPRRDLCGDVGTEFLAVGRCV
jgi:uncharacterized protein YbaR (Trm112 family)